MSREYTYGELKESKIIFDRRPPAFGVIMTLMTLMFVISVIIWAAVSPKTYVVRAAGLVASENRVNIMNVVSGSISEINVGNGQAVERGDILIVFDSFQLDIQIAQIRAEMDIYETRVNVIKRMIRFVDGFELARPETRINPFSLDNPNELRAFSDAQLLINFANQQEAENGEFGQSDIDNIKPQLLSPYYTAFDELQLQIAQVKSQLAMNEDSLALFTIRAEQSGIVHLTAGLTVGTVLQAGTLLGSISSDYSGSFYFDSMVSVADRAKLNVGDEVETTVAGAMQAEFGVITGRVIHIDSNSTQTQDGGVFFRVMIRPDVTYLEDRRGNRLDLSTGMMGESRITYDQTTWLRWAIERIGVRFR